MSFLITMSQKELHCLEVIQKIHDRRLNVVQGAGVLGNSRSQMHRNRWPLIATSTACFALRTSRRKIAPVG